jgi:polyether ionophore transport system permease protein
MTGAGVFLRHFLRHDRWQMLGWGIFAAFLYVSQAVGVDRLYTSQAEFDRAAASMENNAAFVAMLGPARALNTVGGQVTWQAAAFGAIVAGLMSMFIVGRHTRREEESGRDELLRAAPVDRFAPMTAALIDAMIANLLMGALVAGSLIAYGLAVPDSLALGVGLTVCGWFFCGVALVAAQLTTSTRAMYGVTGAVIGLTYVQRVVGDVSDSWLSWTSPIGWYQGMHAFSGLRWWPLVPLALASAAAVAGAYAVFTRRDFGAGVLADRRGPARAGRDLRSGFGLAWHLQRGSIIGWSLGMAFMGLAFGSMGKDVQDLMGDSQVSRDIMAKGGGNLVDAFFATSVLMLAVAAGGFSISSALRPRAEEDEGRVEELLGTALPRERWLLGHVILTVVGSIVVVVSAGLGMASGYVLVTGDSAPAWTYVQATFGYVIPVLALGSIARLLHGWAPRWASLAWLGLVFAAVVVLFGEVFQVPQWLQDVSPFEHLALVPSEPFQWTPVLVIGAIGLALSLAGQMGFARRDVS